MPKPLPIQYPKQIRHVGDELRTVRLNRKMTQMEVATQLEVNRNFVSEAELNNRTNTIFALHKIYLFLGYIPETLKIDESTLQGKLYAHRIKFGYTFRDLVEKIGLDKSTIGRFEKGITSKQETIDKIEKYLKRNVFLFNPNTKK